MRAQGDSGTNRRALVLGLAVIAAIAVAVPAVAGEFDGKQKPQVLDAKKVQDEARKLSHRALRIAKRALRQSSQQIPVVGPGGPAGAGGAVGAAGVGNTPFYDEALGQQSTDDDTQFLPLPGGPSVTVTVPQAANGPGGVGWINVAVSVYMTASGTDGAGAVSIYEDGVPMDDQGDICEFALGLPGPALFASLDGLEGTYSTPGVIDPISGLCASTSAAAPVTIETTPGTHNYELYYNYCGCGGTTQATFEDRRLWITPLG